MLIILFQFQEQIYFITSLNIFPLRHADPLKNIFLHIDQPNVLKHLDFFILKIQ